MRRSRHTIILQILTLCKNGASKTRIVYQGNLNFKTGNFYINILMKNGLINIEDGSPQKYQTTSKGVNLLNSLSKVNSEIFQM
jgi:predicted transcriptional regulator